MRQRDSMWCSGVAEVESRRLPEKAHLTQALKKAWWLKGAQPSTWNWPNRSPMSLLMGVPVQHHLQGEQHEVRTLPS